MTAGVLTILPILRPSPPVFAPPAARFKIERVLTAIRGKLLSPPAISVPIEIPMEGFNNFGIVQMGPDFLPVLRQIIITHSLVPRVLRLNHRQLRSCYLSKMKIAVMVRQLDLGHILWCGRVVRVERTHRVRVVRSVQKMPDVGSGVIGFDHVRFHVCDLVMAFLEDELVISELKTI